VQGDDFVYATELDGGHGHAEDHAALLILREGPRSRLAHLFEAIKLFLLEFLQCLLSSPFPSPFFPLFFANLIIDTKLNQLEPEARHNVFELLL
jgi:hypothetical protein